MISISISIAFILGYLASPAKIINDLLLSVGLGNSLLAKALVGQTIQYVIPAILVYLIFSRATIRSRITVTDRNLWVLRICNAISIAYVAIRLFAGLIPGGGPGFVVSQFSIVTIVPAIGISLLALVQIARRSFGSTGLVGGIALCVLAIGVLPFRIYLQKFQAGGVWDEYCKESGDRFISKPVDFKGLQFRSVGELKIFTSVVGQSYSEAHREYVGVSLIKHGMLQEYEDVDRDSIRPPKRIFFTNGIQEEPLTSSRATHSVSLSYPRPSKEPQFFRFSIVVTDLRTGLVIAESSRVENVFDENKRVCGEVRNGTIDASDFVGKALGLTSVVRN
ncbi:MAG: hypothetical protein Q7T10_11395 [Rhodoferax sp.]|uniref:hypothetical protein n=1 Tax=Rhodoferax sp. TaxID=50421 RepID=UPI002717A88A|nr:hypothetical protein [Rhodoferax sp.]MDO8449396.1 hypothetical protein [Rhodoferax sp.]